MRKLLFFAVLLCLIGSVDATCETFWDYCMNYSLNPNVEYYFFRFNNLENETDMEGNLYMNSTLQRVYAATTNGVGDSAAEWTEPYLTSNGYELYVNNIASCSPNCVGDGGYLTVCLNSTGYVYNHPTTMIYRCPTGGGSCYNINLNLTDFEQYYRRNWTFIDDSTGTAFDFIPLNVTMTVSCNDYADVVISNNTLAKGTLTLQTKQEPRYSVIVMKILNYTFSPRIRQDKEHFLKDNYLLTRDKSEQTFAFRLVDYSGGYFSDSTIYIQKAIGNLPPQNLHVEPFGVDNYVYPLLMNNTNYKIVVKTNTSSRDLGSIYATDPYTVKDVIITTPYVLGAKNIWDNGNISFVYDYNNGLISCVYYDKLYVSWAELEVYNDTGLIHEYNETRWMGISGTMSYTAGTSEQDFKLKCTIADSDGIREAYDTVYYRNTSAYYKGFDLNLPSTIFGISYSTFYTFSALAIIIVIAGIFGMINIGFGAVITSVLTMFFTYVGWLSIPWWFVVLIFFLSILFMLAQNRAGVVT